MIVSDLLDFMTTFNNELDASSGSADEDRAISALNLAVDYCEAVAASLPKVLSIRGVNPIPTEANTESVNLPGELLRVDRLFMMDPSSALPLYPLQRIFEVGGHIPSLPWPLNYVTSPAAGMPRGYYIDGSSLYFQPIPDAVYDIRAYGLWAAPLFVDRNSPLPVHWPDSLGAPLAAFAVKYGNVAVGDPTDDIQRIASEFFTPVLRSLRRRDRSSPTPRHYEYVHNT